MDVRLKGIGTKNVKVDDEVEIRFVVQVEITCEDFDEAVDVAKKIKVELGNLLDGQETLEKHVNGGEADEG
jgi:hypothetical protein